MRRRFTILLAGLASINGCTDAFYKQWADNQVSHIVREREQQTLKYTPDVEATTTVQAKPGKTAYAKVPPTPRPPATTSPVEPSDMALPYGRLGPAMIFPAGVSAPQTADYGLDVARLREARRLSLGPPAPGKQVMRQDLFGSLRYAVLHSREYQSRMEDLYLAALEVTIQRHLFDPIPSASTGLRYSGAQESQAYGAVLAATNKLGLSQRLPYGGSVAANATVDFVRAISGNAQSGETAAVALTASIPLLRGAGLVNLESLIQSERDMVYEVRRFEDYRRNFAVNVASSYFQLLTAQQAIANRAANLVSLQGLTARTQALFAAGRLNQIDVQRSQQQQLQAEQSLINAQASYRSSLDDFKLLIGLPVDQPLEIIAQELAVDIPKYAEVQVADLALKYRLDLRTAEDRVEDSQRDVAVAQNGLLPDLNINAGAGFANLANTPAVRINNDATVYNAAVTLEIPLDRLAERNRYRASLIQLERSQRSLIQLKDEIAADARQSLRLIESAQVSLQIQEKGIELAKLTLENANELLRQGKKDSRDFVDAQNDLLQAQDAYAQANATLQIQVLRFLRDTGTMRVDPDAGAIGAALDRRKDASEAPKNVVVPVSATVNEPPTGG